MGHIEQAVGKDEVSSQCSLWDCRSSIESLAANSHSCYQTCSRLESFHSRSVVWLSPAWSGRQVLCTAYRFSSKYLHEMYGICSWLLKPSRPLHWKECRWTCSWKYTSKINHHIYVCIYAYVRRDGQRTWGVSHINACMCRGLLYCQFPWAVRHPIGHRTYGDNYLYLSFSTFSLPYPLWYHSKLFSYCRLIPLSSLLVPRVAVSSPLLSTRWFFLCRSTPCKVVPQRGGTHLVQGRGRLDLKPIIGISRWNPVVPWHIWNTLRETCLVGLGETVTTKRD